MEMIHVKVCHYGPSLNYVDIQIVVRQMSTWEGVEMPKNLTTWYMDDPERKRSRLEAKKPNKI